MNGTLEKSEKIIYGCECGSCLVLSLLGEGSWVRLGWLSFLVFCINLLILDWMEGDTKLLVVTLDGS